MRYHSVPKMAKMKRDAALVVEMVVKYVGDIVNSSQQHRDNRQESLGDLHTRHQLGGSNSVPSVQDLPVPEWLQNVLVLDVYEKLRHSCLLCQIIVLLRNSYNP